MESTNQGEVNSSSVKFDFAGLAKLKTRIGNRQKLYEDLKHINSPKGCLDYVGKVFSVIAQTIGFVIGVAISSIIPLAMIIVGSINIGNCPAERYIPIYLIVAGVFGVLQSMLSVGEKVLQKRQQQNDSDSHVDTSETASKGCVANTINGVQSLLFLFQLCWFIAGNVWVFRTDPQFVDPSQSSYCHKSTYYFAFGLIIFAYVMILFSILLGCCCCCVMCGIAVWLSDDNNDKNTHSGENSREMTVSSVTA